MKYEAVFGDQGLFDGAPECAVIAIKRPFISGVRSEEMYFFSSTFDAVMKAGSSFNFNNVILKTAEYAERRIIAEHKRWTVADQQAGRDPKVGDRCFSDDDKQPARVIAKDVDGDFWIQCDNGYVRCTDQHKISPLETPEEKAIRLEDEFRDAIYAQTSSLFKTSDEIKAFNIGVRSAYRAMNKPNEQS